MLLLLKHDYFYLEFFMLPIIFLFATIVFSTVSLDIQTQDYKTYVISLPPLGILVTNDTKVNQVYRKQSNFFLNKITLDEKLVLFENPSITTSLIALSYDALYTDAQQLTVQRGTSEQKALFNFQVTPEKLAALNQE